MRLRHTVVHATQHDVFKGHKVPRGFDQIALTRRHQFTQGVFFIQRHEFIAQIIGRRVQGHCQCHRTIIAQSIHHRHNPRSRNRHATARQAIGVVIQHEIQCRHERVVIEQRLAHAHHHHIGNHTIAFGVCPKRMVRPPQLANNFARGQIAVKTLMPR